LTPGFLTRRLRATFITRSASPFILYSGFFFFSSSAALGGGVFHDYQQRLPDFRRMG
jgi:hypothetical protein